MLTQAYRSAAAAPESKPFHMVSVLEGLGNHVGQGATVYYDRGVPPVQDLARDTQFMTEASGGDKGVKVEYFNNPTLSGTPDSTKNQHSINTAGVGWESLMDDPETAMALFASGEKTQKSRRWTALLHRRSCRPVRDRACRVQAKAAAIACSSMTSFSSTTGSSSAPSSRTPRMQLSAGPHKVVVEDYQDSTLRRTIRASPSQIRRKLVSANAKALAAKADVVVIAAGMTTIANRKAETAPSICPSGRTR